MSEPNYASIEDMQAWASHVMRARNPDFIVGDNYLKRWFIVPRNRMSNVYLHWMVGDDDDRALHDHPWSNTSVIIQGGYIEVTPKGRFERCEGDVIHRDAKQAHRLVMHRDDEGKPIPCISLFYTGPNVREWGFHCPKGWVHWRDFVDERGTGRIGRGCGEHD